METEKESKEKPSEFYFACRSNDIETVDRYLKELSLDELDRFEPNGSTGLHAACYFNSIDVAKRLLERGCTRRRKNFYDQTPYEEAQKHPKIRQLFVRSTCSKRFGGDIDPEAEQSRWIAFPMNDSRLIPEPVSEIYEGNRLSCRAFHDKKILEQLGETMPKIDVIERLFRRAVEEKDATYLIQAYTVETDLADRINNYLVKRNERKTKNPSDVIMQYIETIHHNVDLHTRFHFVGKCYRLMKICSDQDLRFFSRGSKLMNKTLISASKDLQITENYFETPREHGQYMVSICFDVREKKSALDIENLSEFPHEKEVLIMINRLFKVVDIRTRSTFDFFIDLVELSSTKL